MGLRRKAEVVIADNGSTDGSQEIARSAGARVVEVAERGYGTALMGGFEAARGRYLVMGDAYRYPFVVPYPTDESFSPDVRAARSYLVQDPRERVRLSIREEAIQSGGSIPGPNLQGRTRAIGPSRNEGPLGSFDRPW